MPISDIDVAEEAAALIPIDVSDEEDANDGVPHRNIYSYDAGHLSGEDYAELETN
jgi:hypothetical protein